MSACLLFSARQSRAGQWPRVLMVMLVCLLLFQALPVWSQMKEGWRAATAAELEAFLPTRATVEKEHIETEMRTASGIINDRGQLIASVVLITAGYAADGKYSHYLLLQQPMTIGENIALPPGAYVVGWSRTDAGLLVHVYEAASGVERGASVARPMNQPGRIESFRIWPPGVQRVIQIGRFFLPYTLGI